MVVRVVRVILSKWFLLVYLGLGLIYFIALPFMASPLGHRQSLGITIALMTGSDPYSFKDTIGSYLLVWGLAWLIHIASWLLIPTLIALLITDAIVEINKDRDLKSGLNQMAREFGIKKERIPAVTDKILAEIEAWLTESSGQGAAR